MPFLFIQFLIVFMFAFSFSCLLFVRFLFRIPAAGIGPVAIRSGGL
jgi:hypothetical protein